jgi:hypothetical protein
MTDFSGKFIEVCASSKLRPEHEFVDSRHVQLLHITIYVSFVTAQYLPKRYLLLLSSRYFPFPSDAQAYSRHTSASLRIIVTRDRRSSRRESRVIELRLRTNDHPTGPSKLEVPMI